MIMFFNENRSIRKVLFCIILIVFSTYSKAQQTRMQYLSGTDKDHTVLWDFYCTGGRNSNKWTKIAVPSNWETRGFGTINYGHDKIKGDEKGLYKYKFHVNDINRKRVFIVFEGSMTDTKVFINGIQAGPVHQGSFCCFKYDITKLIKADESNLLEVTVSKMSDNPSVNRTERNNSDFWIFGGIYRPVYLEIVPERYIDHVAIDGRSDGEFYMNVFPHNLRGGEIVETQIQTLDGKNIGRPFSVSAQSDSGVVQLHSRIPKPKLWSSEFPNLYRVVVTLRDKSHKVHQVSQKFGFRSIDIRPGDGLYVNGVKIYLKGCDRHSFWPESGRTLSPCINIKDVQLMKSMNMNAVRMSHYPPDRDFLDACDSLGLYVLDELTGWQACYDTIVGKKLVKEMVQRDANHPSILFWDNGNEGGFNFGLDDQFDRYDLQNRKVLHPWAKFSGMDTKHYPTYSYILSSMNNESDILMPTEFMHGLYDGGAAASLGDIWNAMLKHPHCAGGFIWALFDEALYRADKNGLFDTDGNFAPDGITGPHREKEGSYFAIREIWSPIHVDTPLINKHFDGRLEIENRYAFTDLAQCKLTWKLVKFSSPFDKKEITDSMTGIAPTTRVASGGNGSIQLGLPPDWYKYDVLYLTAYGPDRKMINIWSWSLKSPGEQFMQPVTKMIRNKPLVNRTDSLVIITCDDKQYFFNEKTGFLEKVQKGKTSISLAGGPRLAGVKTKLNSFKVYNNAAGCVIEAHYTGEDGEDSLNCRWAIIPGRPAQLDYNYMKNGAFDYAGVDFDYPEAKITGMKWLGNGPYRVWKNRLEGVHFGIWHKAYNNTVTGETWQYPEFKGYHSNIYWVTIENTESDFTVFTKNRGVFLQMLHPQREKSALSNNNVEPAFPTGSIGFMTAISPIGTKFHSADKMGPQGQKNTADGKPTYETLWFDFFHK